MLTYPCPPHLTTVGTAGELHILGTPNHVSRGMNPVQGTMKVGKDRTPDAPGTRVT
jgi:hypothetical protein